MLARNVLIFHAGALGDFVLTWPLALALGRLYPQSRILYVTAAQKGALAERVLGVEASDIESGWHHLFSDPSALPARPGKLLAGAHSIVSFLSTPEDAWTAHVRQLAPRANLLHVRPVAPTGYPAHATDYLLEQLLSQPVVHAALQQILRSIADRGIRFPLSPGAVVIHPGSGSPRKCWPLENFIELIRRLRQQNVSVRTLYGEVEEERWPASARAALAEVAPVHRPSSYLDLLKELSCARLVLGNDSGPGHLAGILGVPTLSLFGPTSAATWRPLGPRTDTLQAAALESLTCEAVLARLQQMLG